MINRYLIKKKSWDLVTKDFGNVFVFFSPAILISILSAFISSRSTTTKIDPVPYDMSTNAQYVVQNNVSFDFLSPILAFLSILIIVSMVPMIYRAYKTNLSKELSIKKLLPNMKNSLLSTLCLYGAMIAIGFGLGIIILLALLPLIIFVGGATSLYATASGNFGTYGIEGLGLFFFLLIAIMIAMIVLLVYISIRLSQTQYVLSDVLFNITGAYSDIHDRKVSFAIKESWRMTKGKVGQILFFHLSFVGWYILCAFILPMIFVIPYTEVAAVGLYTELVYSKYPNLLNK